MVTTPHSPSEDPTAHPGWRWWLSLYPRLSLRAKRGVVVACLGAAMLAQSLGVFGSPAGSQSASENAAVQNVLHQLGLLDPVGNQFQVNSYTTNAQSQPSVAIDSGGNFVVVWYSNGSGGPDTSGESIQGQRFNAAGTAQGSQFQVNSYTANNQRLPAVAMDSNGDFVVVWQSDGGSGGDSDGYSIQGQRYNSVGTTQGGQFQVNSYTTSNQTLPSVALDSNGDFVVVWQSTGSSGGDTNGDSIQGQRYNSAGTAQGNQFQVNSYTTLNQRAPNVSLDSDGDFVVVWHGEGSSGSDTHLYSLHAQRYNTAGTAQGSEFQVNSYTTNGQGNPVVALDSDGDFVVAWESGGSGGNDTYGVSIHGQRYNEVGTAQGSEFQVNSYTTSNQRYPAVAIDSSGNFVIVWQSFGSSGGDTGSLSIQKQGYTSAGTAQGSQSQVNTYTTGNQFNPAVALDGDGDHVIIWQSYGSSVPGPGGGPDTSLASIQGQRFTADGATPIPTPTASNTPSPTATNTPTLVPTITSSPTPGPSSTPTFTPTAGPSSTPTPSPTAGPSTTPTATATTPAQGDEFVYLPAIIKD